MFPRVAVAFVVLIFEFSSCRCKDAVGTGINIGIGVSSISNGLPDVLLEKVLLDSLMSVPLPYMMGMTGEDQPQLSSALLASMLTERDVGFFLYTRKRPGETVALEVGDVEGLWRSNFSSEAPTKILIHGWTDSGSSPWMHEMCRNYLSVSEHNVVIVDWSVGSNKEYLVSARLTMQVGEYVARFVDFLVSEGAIDSPDSVHMLGHSLGAHIAGIAGSVLSASDRQIGRITGMDPARPDFEAPLLREPKERLDSADAKFVDVIHTCAGTAGFVRPIGHADFYPNGGSFRQPGCPVISAQYCSHGRSHQFVGESIVNPLGFPAVECYGWKEFKANKCDPSRGNQVVYMGEQLDADTRGVFFLETNAEPPFGRSEL